MGRSLISRDEARKKAEDFARKMRPEEFAKTRPDNKNEFYGYYYPQGIKQMHNFYWQRFENGIAVEEDGINVGIDALSGGIQNYHFNWQRGVQFPAPGEVMKAGAVAEKAMAELGLYLGYTVPENARVGSGGVPVNHFTAPFDRSNISFV